MTTDSKHLFKPGSADPNTMERIAAIRRYRSSCPDGGTCHHQCSERCDCCWRVQNAGPLSGVFPNDVWP